MAVIALARVYADDAADRPRFLVERLWPRGVRRADLKLTDWLPEVGPSDELRRWFAHDPRKWEDFRRRYFAELDDRPESWRPLWDAAAAGDITLLFSSRDVEHNNAVALREYLMMRLEADDEAPSIEGLIGRSRPTAAARAPCPGGAARRGAGR